MRLLANQLSLRVYVCLRHCNKPMYHLWLHKHNTHAMAHTYLQAASLLQHIKPASKNGNVSLPGSPDKAAIRSAGVGPILAPLLPAKRTPHKVTLVLDLDETLVRSYHHHHIIGSTD